MDRCDNRSVEVLGVVHSYSSALGVHMEMGCGYEVVEGPSGKFLTLKAAEPSLLALEVEVDLPESYPRHLKVRIQDLCEQRMDWVLALNSSSDYLGHGRCCGCLVMEHHHETDLNGLRVLS